MSGNFKHKFTSGKSGVSQGLPGLFYQQIVSWVPHLNRRNRLRVASFCLLLLMLLVLDILPKPLLSSYYPKSTAIYARNHELLRLTLAADQQFRLWVPLAQIPENLIKATLLYEDQWFYQHPGINPIALMRSVWITYLKGARQGASTITMQVARQRYRIESRKLSGKFWQMLAAIWLELRYSKQEILETYLNIAPYGGNIAGTGAASLIYFHKPVSQLSLPEAITLAVIPQNPKRRNPTRERSYQLPPALFEARQRLWRRWRTQFPEAEHFAGEFALPIKIYTKQQQPFMAPHLTTWLLQHYPNRQHLQTSIHLGAQNALKQLIDQYMLLNRNTGIRNASALLVDTSTMQVTAAVGSANFWDKHISGQVNGLQAKRSPGSTLKPFVYALGLDQGLLHPHTVLPDLPKAFGAFSPENFDGRFLGPVTAQDALIRSRNIPAITIAAKLAKPNLYEFLQQAGISGLASENHYGLSIALGGCEVTMEELAELYALLNNQGQLKSLRYLEEPKTAEEKGLTLLSPEAAYIALDMLSANLRPDSKRPAVPRVAWKTGTSWGFKDAWSVGSIGHYVLVVWLGNFDNRGNTAFIGIQSAAPLFFNIVDALRNRQLLKGLDADLLAHTPPHAVQIEVCAASGELPNPECPTRVPSWFIPGKSPIKMSNLHRAVYFDNEHGAVVCPGTPNSRREVYEFWSSDMFKLFQDAGLPRRMPPSLPGCYEVGALSSEGPQIISPSKVGIYTLRIGKLNSIGLKANNTAGGMIFWFANKSFLGKVAASEVLAWLPTHPGQYVLRAVDSQGRAAFRDVQVEFVP